MHFIFDNLIATIVGAVVILMVIAVNLSNRKGLNDTTAFHVTVLHQEAFAQIVMRDMQGVEQLLTVTENPADSTFRFGGHIGDDPTLYNIVYKREFTREQDGIRYHRIKRFVDGQLAGGSSDVIVEWQVEGRDASGTPVSDTDAVVQLYVHFEVASLIGQKASVENTYWETSFFPPLLQ